MHDLYTEPDTARLLESFRAMGGVKLRNLPLAEARALAAGLPKQLDLPCLVDCAITPLLIPGKPPRPARLYVPRGGQDLPADAETPVILYAHGGGWVLGDLDYGDALCRHLATRTRCRVVSVDYRLAPEHPFPAAFEDVANAVRWISTSPPALRVNVSGVALAGDSVGGALIAAAALHHEHAASAPLVALLMLYPVTDVSRSRPSYRQFAENFLLEAADMHYFAAAYAPEAKMRHDPRVSPLLSDSLAALPPTTLLACGLDILRDDGRAFAAHLARDGVDMTYIEARGQIHGMATMRGALPSARAVIDRAIDDFRGSIERSRAATTDGP